MTAPEARRPDLLGGGIPLCPQRGGAGWAGLRSRFEERPVRATGRRGAVTRLRRPPASLERNALDMIKRRVKKAGLPDSIGNHICRATGITKFLEAGGTLEEAANLANHADMRTTRIYDKRDRVIRRTSV